MNQTERARKLLRAIGDADDRFLLEAMEETAVRRNRQKRPVGRGAVLRWAAAAAACLALAMAGSQFLPLYSGSSSGGETTDMAATGDSAAEGSPYMEVADMEEAETITGFSLEAPELDTAETTESAEDAEADASSSDAGSAALSRVISVLDGTMIEVSYQTSDGVELYAVRKAEGEDDISGDYEEYASVAAQTIGGRAVTLKGDGETVSVAVWQQEGYSYALCAENSPMTREEAAALIEAIDP